MWLVLFGLGGDGLVWIEVVVVSPIKYMLLPTSEFLYREVLDLRFKS